LALNVVMNGGFNGNNGRAMDPRVVDRMAEIPPPVRVFTFLDEEAASMTCAAFFVYTADQRCWWMIPGARDRAGGANVAFADGHVDFNKWRYPGRTRTGPYTSVRNDQDRADLIWVQRAVVGQ